MSNLSCVILRKAISKIFFVAKRSGYDPVLSLIQPRISMEDSNKLTVPMVKEEFHATLLDMHPNKSPVRMALIWLYIITSGICVEMIFWRLL